MFAKWRNISGRLEPLLGLLWRELLRCVFVDDSNDGDGDDAATTTPARGEGAGGGRRTSFRGAARLALGAVRASNRAAKYIDTEPSGSSRREEGEHAL